MNMRFRQIVNICRFSRKKWKTSDIIQKHIPFTSFGYSNLQKGLVTPQRRHITTSRYLCNVSEDELKKLMDQLGEKFTEARELMDDARESEGTVYFSDDLDDAQKAVTETLEEYNRLLENISETQKETVVRTIGLRMGELKAQLDAINEKLKD